MKVIIPPGVKAYVMKPMLDGRDYISDMESKKEKEVISCETGAGNYEYRLKFINSSL